MKKLLILAVLLAAPAMYAAAEQYACCNYEEKSLYGLNTNTTRVEFFGGVAIPQGYWDESGQRLEVGDLGFSGGIAFVRNVLPVLSLGLDANFSAFSKGDDVLYQGQNVNYRSGVGTALVTGRFYLFPKSMTRLYATGGIGAGYMYAREKNVNTKDTKIYDSVDFAWMLGAGLEFDIDETVIFGVEGRYNWTALRSEMKDRFGHDDFDYWTVLLKLGVKF